ncbi:hypothetical protein [Streptomyces fulvorobeus]|uniref:Uncharacterized protein n=1 Tax=Streptomyces fulvorobeus TaxID=284028 RepID=A0A7J0C9I5_9ACTN|nr:hypothetical protein [Streptomyces fulvorobeus]NYE42744.1 hypothetical protein [Streptomyces fulvorobeus]GFM99159.1 hypothetical protein Sfulv_39700 [Streptomyces fulvorobeus]
MSLQEELTLAQNCLDDLVRTIGRLERSLARLREEAAARTGTPEHPADMVTITEGPYDATLWTDSDDEGLGVRGRHAP